MQVRIEDVSPVEKKLFVEVPWETVSIKLAEAYRELAKGVQLKGFRKGKVPRSMLQQMFGKRVNAEVVSELVRESFISAATEHNLQIVSDPVVEETPTIKKGQPFAFEAVVQVRGEVEAKDYDGMELTRRPVNVAEETVDRALEALRRDHTELLPIEGRDVSARTDVLSIAVKGTIGEIEVDREGLGIDLEDHEKEPIPGLAAALTNLPLDSKDHELELTIPDDYYDQSAAGKVAKLRVSIIDARRKEVPDLDDELAKDTGRAETLEELRKVVREDLEKRQEEQIQRELHDAALKELVKRNQIPVADSLTDRAVQMQHDRLKMMLGIDPDDPDTGGQIPLDDEMRDKMRPAAVDEVRGQLLLDAIAKQEGIEVTEADLDAHVEQMANMRGMPPARFRAELAKEGQLEAIQFQLRQDKVLDLLVERAVVTVGEPTAEGSEAAPAAEQGDVGSGEPGEDAAPAEPEADGEAEPEEAEKAE